MTIDVIKKMLPEFAKDIRLNLSAVLDAENNTDLTQSQIDICALAVAYATKNKPLIAGIETIMHDRITEAGQHAAKAAATIMAMNNIYYRFTHTVSDNSFATMPAKLRMNVIANPGVEKVDFELASLAVSILNGCGMCMDAHTRALLKAGISKEGVQSVARIAAVLNATNTGMEIQAV